MSNDILDRLERAVAAYGVPVTRHAHHLAVDGDRLVLKAGVLPQPDAQGRAVTGIQLQALAAELHGRPIVETFFGTGPGHAEALENAGAKLELSALHPLLEALTTHRCKEGQAGIARWGRDDASWRVHSAAPVTEQGYGLTLMDAYPAFLSALSRRFLQTAPPGPHWIRVIVACYENQIQTAHVLVDNETWLEGQQLLRAQPWALTQSYQSIRHFLLAMPEQA